MTQAIGIDLGGTGIYGALVDRSGAIVAEAERPTPVAEGPAAVLRTMFGMVRTLLDRAAGRVAGIGLGIPGLVDREAGVSVFSPNLRWDNVAVLEPFRREFGLPVAMDNDVRVGALGELHFGAGRKLRNFLFTALGTGIGSGIVIDREIYRGPYNTAGEFGHIPIRPYDGVRCGCGATGCLETLASGPAVRRRALEALDSRPEAAGSLLQRLPREQVSARTVAEAARAGDRLANMIMAEVGMDLGLGILAYYNLMGPDAVIVGGGVALAGDLILEPARSEARARAMPGIRQNLKVLPAQLGDEAGAIGAATLSPGFID